MILSLLPYKAGRRKYRCQSPGTGAGLKLASTRRAAGSRCCQAARCPTGRWSLGAPDARMGGAVSRPAVAGFPTAPQLQLCSYPISHFPVDIFGEVDC